MTDDMNEDTILRFCIACIGASKVMSPLLDVLAIPEIEQLLWQVLNNCRHAVAGLSS
jgi:hypothetical protein